MRRSLALAVAGVLVFAAPAWADREHSTNNTSKKLREAVTVAGIMEHQNAFEDIGTITGGNRLSGTAGYDASATTSPSGRRLRASRSAASTSTTTSTCSPTSRRRS